MRVGGMPLIELVARRASRSGFEVVVATSVEAYDDRIAQHLSRVGLPVVRGPLDDVLGRFIDGTKDMDDQDRVVRLTGDNPVADASLIQEVMDATFESGYEYGRVDIDEVPEGLGVEVFSVASLREADAKAESAYDREHVTPWIRRNREEYLCVPKANYSDPTIYRCTTDCLHDYDRVSRLFDSVTNPVDVDWREIINYLDDIIAGYGSLAINVGTARRRLTSVILGSSLVGILDKGRSAPVVREVFAAAVNRGISHAYFRAHDAKVVTSGTLPGLRQRLQSVVVLDDAESGLGVRAELETVFAHLGQRRADTVLIPYQDGIGESSMWTQLRRYREEGVIRRIGVQYSPNSPRVDTVPEQAVSAHVVPPHNLDTDRIRADVQAGLITFAVLPNAGDKRVADLTQMGAIVVTQPRNVSGLESTLARAARAHEKQGAD